VVLKYIIHVKSIVTASISETVSDGDGNFDMDRLYTYTKGSLTDTTKILPACFSFDELMYPGMWLSEHEGEKAAGTPISDPGSDQVSTAERRCRDIPMMMPLPLVNSFARLTLLPGEPSTRSTSGTLSPTLTNAGAEAWNRRRPATEHVNGRIRAESMVNVRLAQKVLAKRMCGDGSGGRSELAQAGMAGEASLAGGWPIAPSTAFRVTAGTLHGYNTIGFSASRWAIWKMAGRIRK
jgi:hypothetical protein